MPSWIRVGKRGAVNSPYEAESGLPVIPVRAPDCQLLISESEEDGAVPLRRKVVAVIE